MKKSIVANLILAILTFSITACSDSDHNEYGYVSQNGYKPMTVEHKDATYAYLGTDGVKDYDAECLSDHGAGWLSFIPDYSSNTYVCLRSCKARDNTDSSCETVNNENYGMIDIATVFKCEEFDGKLVYIVAEYRHCNNACTSDHKACD